MGISSLHIAAPRDQDLADNTIRSITEIVRCEICDLAREADHRIANHLAMLAGYVDLKQKETESELGADTRPTVRRAFADMKAQLSAVSSLHRSLSSHRPGFRIDLGEHLHQICAPFASGLSGAIELVEDLHAGCLVQSEQILPLTQIASEVVTNAIKYSHARGEPGKIVVSCHLTANALIEMGVRDDGAGLPQLNDPLTSGGLGFRLIRALTKQLGAQSGFESSLAGTRFWLRLKSTPQTQAREQTGASAPEVR